MKVIKKTASIVLVVMMIMCAFTAVSFSASAATGNTITVSSNLTSPLTCEYDANSKQVTVTYSLQSYYQIINTQAECHYDSNVLKLASTNTKSTCVPVFSDAAYFNANLDNRLKFNASSLDLFNFKTKATYLTLTFDIVGTGDTTVDLDVQVITATTATTSDDLTSASDIDLVFYDTIATNGFKMTAAVNVDSGEISTTPEPTTPDPTVPATTSGSDVPSDGYYVVSNDFKLKLTPSGTNKVVGDIALKAGSYQFKLDNNGTLLGYGKTFTDTTNGLTFQSKFSAYATLLATGGVYTFQVNTNTNTLIVKCDNNLPNQYLIGDINTILKPVEGRTLAIGTSYLAAGTYAFKFVSNDATYAYGGTVSDTTNGRSLTFQTKFSAYCTLNATGGIYTFTLNTATNKLQVSYMEAKDEANDDVHLSGDINAVLDDNGGASNIATATVTLAEGNYSFKVYNYGIAYTGGVKIVDTGLKNLKSSQISPVTLVASGGSYLIKFNKSTGQLSIVKE